MYNIRQQSTTGYVITFPMFDNNDHITGLTGLIPQINLSKNGSTFTSASGTITEIGYGWYKFNYNSVDTNTLGELVIRASAIGADLYETRFTIVPFNPFDATRLGLSALPNANAGASLGLPINDAIIVGYVNDGNANTSGFIVDNTLSTTNDFYNGSVISFTSGNLRGIARKITDYIGSTKQILLFNPLPVAPSNTDTFVILGRID